LDRQIVGPGQLPLDTDLLNTNKNVLLALGALAQSMFGTNTIAYGLGVTPTTPASLSVNVAPGSIYAASQIDATAYGSIPADTVDIIVKQGIQLAASQLALLAPATAGFSVNYLIEAAFTEVDGVPQLLPYYNATNPQQPYQGPGGNNQQTNTRRQGLVSLVAKAGIAATTGTQATPSIDAGSIPLAVVTVAYGQTQITATNIVAVKSNVLPADLLDSVQQNRLDYAVDTGAANAYAIALQPTPNAIPDGFIATFQASNSNTGASTINVSGFGAYPILGVAHSALQGGEIVSAGKCEIMWHQTLASWILLGCTGGAQQTGVAKSSTQAVQFGQLTGMVGSVRHLTSAQNSAGTSLSFTAEQIIAATALGGIEYRLTNFNQTINVATTGTGGMDTGSAPASGFVGIYAIYNPTTGAQSILGTNATATAVPTIYGGGNLPAGYTVSALIGVWPTNSSGQITPGCQNDLDFFAANTIIVSTTAAVTTPTLVNASSMVPKNARTMRGALALNASSGAQNASVNMFSSSTGSVFGIQNANNTNGGGQSSIPFNNFPLLTPQTFWWDAVYSSGSSIAANVCFAGYSI